MNYKAITSLLVLIPLLLGGVSTSHIVTGGSDIAPAASVKPQELLNYTQISLAGTMWQPQRDTQFSQWVVYGWGTAVRSSSAGNRWVHIGIPNTFFHDNNIEKVYMATFCAKSSRGSHTKPIQMDVWSYDSMIGTKTITWASANFIQCDTMMIPATEYRDISISVKLHFANTTDVITLYRAEVSTQH